MRVPADEALPDETIADDVAAGPCLGPCARGCGVLAAPCRVASAGLKIVPVIGDVAALPTDACAEVID